MESNWRETAWDTGFSYQGVGLCARWLDDVPIQRWITNRADIGNTVWALRDLGTGNWVFAGLLPKLVGHPHFPYGYRVTTD